MYDYNDKIRRYERRYESGDVCFDLLAKIPKKYRHIIEGVNVSPDCYMVYLLPGYSVDGCGEFTIVAYTVEDVISDLSRVREDPRHTGY